MPSQSNMFKKILRFFIFRHFKPQMRLGYLNHNNFLAKTRISNTTYIAGESNLTIGDNVFIGHGNFIDASNGLTIGEGVQITNHVSILTHSSHLSIRLYGKHYIQHNGQHIGNINKPVAIGCYSFVGPHSTIMPGVVIGKGSIVSAYSYVKSGNYPDFAILAGNPAGIVGSTKDLDEKLLQQYPELANYYNEWANE